MGLPPEAIEQLQGQATERLFEVIAEAAPIVRIWMRVQTQWRCGPGGYYGLDYPAVFQVMARLKEADPDGEIFDGLQVMETAALNVMTER